MDDTTPESKVEIFEEYRAQSGSHDRRGKCAVFSWRWVFCVLVVVILLVVMGILMAMFGPGSKDLKYHDRKECEGKPSKQKNKKNSCRRGIPSNGLSFSDRFVLSVPTFFEY